MRAGVGFDGRRFVVRTLLFWPNWLPLALSVPVLLFLLGYSFAKRFTPLAHFWLGTALMLAPGHHLPVEPAGTRTLRGLPGRWRLHRLGVPQ